MYVCAYNNNMMYDYSNSRIADNFRQRCSSSRRQTTQSSLVVYDCTLCSASLHVKVQLPVLVQCTVYKRAHILFVHVCKLILNLNLKLKH